MIEYRNILAHVSESPRARAVLELAAQLAAAHGAALSAVHAVEPLYLGAYLSPETAMAAAQLGETSERERIARARALAQEVAQARSLPIAFSSPGGDPLQAMTARARCADLVVVGQPSDDDAASPARRFVSRLLVSAGCPLLFVPSAGPVSTCGEQVLVAWTDSRECARAMRDALPLLQRARSVELLRFGSAADGTGEPLDSVVAYLRSHGVSAHCTLRPMREMSFGERMLTPTVVDAPVAELLLSHAADCGADLVVMGGYGHTRAYELLLGGVTRTMLNSMTLPVLMSH